MASLMHPIMGVKNPVAYSKNNILATVINKKYVQISSDIADLLIKRFNPKKPLSDSDFEAQANEIREHIGKDVVDRNANELLNKMVDILGHMLRTNLFLEDRYALGFRMDPAIMEDVGDVPYGLFFVHGRRFNGYHVRFRDIARGGMRLVTPLTEEQVSENPAI
jgi:glutamate dehydrogenase|tara:strand:+ start:713 stop:1204 length:492 start_codon:yes stop_codon:yes gene_type:complete